MPNMSGETCIKELKQLENFDTPVIALTADAVAGAKEKYLSEGFVSYLQKTFNLSNKLNRENELDENDGGILTLRKKIDF